VHYHRNEAAAQDTLERVRKHGAEGLVLRADVSRPDDIRQMFERVKREFGGLDVFVSNARPDLADFYQAPLDITLDKWEMAFDSQAKAFFVGVREAVPLMGRGGRIIAITYAPSGRTGSWQPWIAMGSAKAALESAVRYFAVALAKRDITVNALSPGLTEDSVLNTLPKQVQDISRSWHESGWTPMGRLTAPEDVGNAVALLCSERAGWITGQVIAVDGGSSLMDTVFPLEIQRG
jgi:NAD(P)-dependent dehydrogenase (short-subunit alcohol dehydrogenase family)